MSKLDHGRPVLRLIDDARQLEARALANLKKKTGPGIAGPPMPTRPRQGSAELHIQALAALQHVLKHKDVRIARAVIEVVHAPRVKVALSTWFCANGPLRLCEITGIIVYDKTAKVQLHEAMIKPYWKHL